MIKGILVIDLPKNCLECPLGKNMSIAIETCIQCPLGRCAVDEETETRPDWCPLKPLPEKLSVDASLTEFQIGARGGYNLCIDRILGDSENE